MAVLETLRNLFAGPSPVGVVVPAPAAVYAIRPLTDKHLDTVVRLNMRCFRNGENYTRHTFNYLLTEPNTISYQVVTETGEMVGFICAIMNPDGTAHLTTLGVAPEHRRRRLAVRMIRHLESAVCARAAASVVLEVRVSNEAAQNLYKRAGYTIVQRLERYYSNGEDGFLMVKSVA
jgi:ribosomal-protein-alanine N-acetyltransferase